MEPVTITDFEFQGKHSYITIFKVDGKIQIHVNLTPMKIVKPEIYIFYWVARRLQWWENVIDRENENVKQLAKEFETYLNLNPQILFALIHNQ